MSAPVSEGADAQRLVEIAGNVEVLADEVEEQRARGRSQVGVLQEAWSGPDLERFTQEWPHAEHSMENARRSLADMGQGLRREAQEQVRASAGTGGITGPGTTFDGDYGGQADGDPSTWGQERDPEDYGKVPEDVKEAWAEYTPEERQAILEQKIREDAEALGIPEPTIIWDDSMSSSSYGGWNDGVVTLNPDKLDQPIFMHTVAHEMRHALQGEAVRQYEDRSLWDKFWGNHPDYPDGTSPEQVKEWKENSGPGYIGSEEDFDAYFDQPVERDARNTGSEWVEGMTPEELDRLLEDSK
ncbi:MAG TPA: WXG100 family type VII secretion target [Candidatus Janibacter merdipullorum]|nr:WXG100 family type VII secretion target [Candidatus Janibacter merdipullorum]